MTCKRTPRFVIAFYDVASGPALGPPEAFGEPKALVSLCEGCAPPYKERMKVWGFMPHHLPPRPGVGCGKEV